MVLMRTSDHIPLMIALVIVGMVLILFYADHTLTGLIIGEPLLDSQDTGVFTENRTSDYQELVDALFATGNVVQELADGSLWVPWYSTSSSCEETDLKAAGGCDIGDVTMTRNCMVTDEFSQVGIVLAMDTDQERMDGFVTMLDRIPSAYGSLPSWRAYRDGETVYACAPGVNSNCDSASDADARIIIALLTASTNPSFTEPRRDEYRERGLEMAHDFVTYNLVNECYAAQNTTICYWLAGGPDVAQAGMGANAFAYTGYFADATIAMLSACSVSGNETYCGLANNVSLSYLQAANFNNTEFTAPPGLNFRWDVSGSEPQAVCTNTCDPISWDGADAPRALGMCQALYYASRMNQTLDRLEPYCQALFDRHMSDPTSAPYQFAPDGSATSVPVTGYFSQGLQSLVYAGLRADYESVINQALGHYSMQTRTFDWAACMGVYHPTIVMRSLGMAIDLDSGAYEPLTSQTTEPEQHVLTVPIDEDVSFTVDGQSASWFLDDQFLADTSELIHAFDTMGEHTLRADRMGDTLAIWTISVEPVVLSDTIPIFEGSTVELSFDETTSWFLDAAHLFDARNFSHRFNEPGLYAIRAERMGETLGTWNVTVQEVGFVHEPLSHYELSGTEDITLTYELNAPINHTTTWWIDDEPTHQTSVTIAPSTATTILLEIDLGHRTIERHIEIEVHAPTPPQSGGRSSGGGSSGSGGTGIPIAPMSPPEEPESIEEPAIEDESVDQEAILLTLIESYENRTIEPLEFIRRIRGLLRGEAS